MNLYLVKTWYWDDWSSSGGWGERSSALIGRPTSLWIRHHSWSMEGEFPDRHNQVGRVPTSLGRPRHYWWSTKWREAMQHLWISTRNECWRMWQTKKNFSSLHILRSCGVFKHRLSVFKPMLKSSQENRWEEQWELKYNLSCFHFTTPWAILIERYLKEQIFIWNTVHLQGLRQITFPFLIFFYKIVISNSFAFSHNSK